MAKYDPLHEYLAASTQLLVRLSFTEIERTLGDILPPSARRHQSW